MSGMGREFYNFLYLQLVRARTGMGTLHAWETYGDGVSVSFVRSLSSFDLFEPLHSQIFKPWQKALEEGEYYSILIFRHSIQL